MCGITGIFDLSGGSEINKNLLSDMNQTQFHRGPDQGGLHIEAGVGLGHRRLSIIDISSGQQPLFNEDDSVVVVYNGEIYNFQTLAEELQAAGHVFKTRCDTEVIVHAWEQWGEACVEKFRGMFAFAIWDRNKQVLFLARDRLGIKPLYYSILNNGNLIFASELKALMIHPKLDRSLDPQAVEDYFAYGYIPEPKTIFKNTAKLLPGHTLTIKKAQAFPKQVEYWDIPFSVKHDYQQEQIEADLITQLKQAVDIRLVAEVPLGAFLSGGVDSSAIVALMSELNESAINTCSISFGDEKFNEATYAHQVAQQYQTNHHVENVDEDDFDLIDQLSAMYDEPFADSSAIPTYRLCELAKKDVTVALSGDGGDENFAGYTRYKLHMMEHRMRSLAPLGMRKPIFGALGKYYPKADWAPRVFRAKTTFEGLARDEVEGYMYCVRLMHDTQRKQMFSHSFTKQLQGYNAVEVLRGYANKAPTDDMLSLIQYLDFKTYLPGDILTKVDRASMAHALEVRVPILDHKFVEWASSIPSSIKLQNNEGKYIFKKSLESHLSHDILYRKKMGFAVPLANWFKGPLRERMQSVILGKTLEETGIFNKSYLETLIKQHLSGKRDNSAPLWSILMFASSLKRLQA